MPLKRSIKSIPGSILIVPFFLGILLAGCSSSPELRIQAVDAYAVSTASPLVGGRSTELSRYHRLIIDPVTAVMPDANHWQNVSAAQRLQATILARDAFTAALSGDLPVTSEVDDDVLRLRFVVEEVQPASLVGVSLTHILPGGLPLNSLKNGTGAESPLLMGTVVIAGELRDARSDALVASFWMQQGPDPAKLVAVATQEDAMKAAIDRSAAKFATALAKARAGAENGPPEQAADSHVSHANKGA